MEMLKVGPEVEHVSWDLEGREQVAGIYIYYNKDKVVALQFLFYENGNLVKSDKYGERSTENANFAALVFDYPSEFLTSVSGSLGEEAHVYSFPNSCMRSVLSAIKIGTNKGSYGPFGSTTATSANSQDFNFHIGRRNLFGGFHGISNSDGIKSIGVYVKMSIPSSSMTSFEELQIKDED